MWWYTCSWIDWLSGGPFQYNTLISPRRITHSGTGCYQINEYARVVNALNNIIIIQNATKATQSSGSRHFQVCLPVPTSSCLFLPTTACLAVIMRLYLPLLTIPSCSMLSLCFFYDHFENILPFLIIVSEKHQKVYQKLPYFPWDFNKILKKYSKWVYGSHWIREMKGER